MNTKAMELYDKKKMKLAIFGLIIAFISSIAGVTFGIFNAASSSIITASFGDRLIILYVLSLITVATSELVGGIITVIFNLITGYPLAEYPRVWKVKISRTILISAILGGPIATACQVMAIALCGTTYTACIVGLTPVVTAILGVIFLKEKTGARVILGIIMVVVGIVVAAMAPPEGIKNFYTGIALACVCPVAFALESIISTHATDVADPRTACPLYRMILSAVMELIIAVVVCAVMGHLDWIGTAYGVILHSPACLLFMFCTSIFMVIQYNCTYTAYTYCGAIKASAILFAQPLWTILVGFLLAALGVLPYAVTAVGVVGAVVVTAGIMIVVAKPSELFSLRN